MKFIMFAHFNAPVSQVETMFGYSATALALFPDVSDVVYINGDPNQESAGTILTMNFTRKRKIIKMRVEILEHIPGVKKITKISYKNNVEQIYSIWFTPLGAESEAYISVDIKFSSYLSVLEPLISARSIATLFAERIENVIKHFGAATKPEIFIATKVKSRWQSFSGNFVLWFCLTLVFMSIFFYIR